MAKKSKILHGGRRYNLRNEDAIIVLFGDGSAQMCGAIKARAPLDSWANMAAAVVARAINVDNVAALNACLDIWEAHKRKTMPPPELEPSDEMDSSTDE